MLWVRRNETDECASSTEKLKSYKCIYKKTECSLHREFSDQIMGCNQSTDGQWAYPVNGHGPMTNGSIDVSKPI